MNKVHLILTFVLAMLFGGNLANAENNPPHVLRDQFGIVTLTSCTNALRMNEPTYLGLEITPAEDWQLTLQDLTVTTSNNTPVEWFTPFKQPLYKRLMYPISALVTNPTSDPITFTANGTIHGCFNGECQLYPFHVTKTLDAQPAWIIPECDSITHALTYTPIPMRMQQIKGWAIPNEQEDIQVTLIFQKNPKTIQIYDIHKNPLILDIQAKETQAQFLWPNPQEPIHFFVRTYYGYYEVDLPVSTKGTQIPMQARTILGVLYAVLLFVVFSAFPIFWVRSTDAPYAVFVKQTKQMIITLLCAGLILGLGIYYKGPFNLAFYPFAKGWTLIGMGLGLLFIPAHMLLPFLFTFLAPKPYLSCIQTLSEQLIFIGVSTCILCISFLLQLIWAKKIFHVLQDKKTVSYAWWCGRLPWLMSIIYFLLYL